MKITKLTFSVSLIGMVLIIVFGFSVLFKVNAVSKPKMKVFLLAGQSNMCGTGNTGDLTPDLLTPVTNVLAYYTGQISDPMYANRMAKLNGHLGTLFGPELTFGLDMEKYYKNDNIALIKVAWGSTGLVLDWNPAEPYSKYPVFKRTVTEQMISLAVNYEPVIIGMLWMQGESDALNINDANAYEENLRYFISSVKTDFNCPKLKFIIGRISDSPAWTYKTIVRASQEKIANDTDNISWIDTDDLPRENIFHYNSQGLLTLGHRFATAMWTLVNADPEPSSSSSLVVASSSSSIQSNIPKAINSNSSTDSIASSKSTYISSSSAVPSNSSKAITTIKNIKSENSNNKTKTIIFIIVLSLAFIITASILLYLKFIKPRSYLK